MLPRSAVLCALLLLCAAVLLASAQAQQQQAPLQQEGKKATSLTHKTSTTPTHKTKPTTRKPSSSSSNATPSSSSTTTTRVKATAAPPTTLTSSGTTTTSAAAAAAAATLASTLASTQQGTTLPALPGTEAPPTTIMDSTASTQAATRDGGGAVGYSPARRETPVPPAAPAGGPQTPGTLSLPGGESATGVLTKPTKYHYYPHNQHIYLLPECAVQQVCNAVYVRLNYTQPLCACPSRHQDPCSASLNSDDLHTTELASTTRGKVLTLAKTCEPVAEVRLCKAPKDWSLLALQNVRTGKSHYLVICRCAPARTNMLEGPIIHDQPTYASVPGIRVYGMVCVKRPSSTSNRKGRPLRYARSSRHPRSAKAYNDLPPFPWDRVWELARAMNLIKG
ncbi:uncharacterized protein DDB_G0290587 [Frankliniella occidentalis]|uniref:Uncharacterized protein DDB_G0290587 n=1 Tax=Frankliniella occidentalis TaxID=133901 RepID=A0A9C6U3Z1_FRAOC|nr:uncharacterized protein DDB_G0290587 [Frankliniella occidentalis]